MNDPVEKYFRDDTSCLFHWTDGGRTLCWLDGTTIAFREELATLLERLSTGCLPGLTSVVVAQAALRQSWPDVVLRLNRVLNALRNSAIPSYADAMRRHEYLTKTWPDSAKKLGILGRYAQSSQASLSERADLLTRVFERLESPWSEEDQQAIARSFRAGLPPEWLLERPRGTSELHLPRTDEDEERWRTDPPLFHRVLHDFLNLLRIARVIAGGLRDADESDLGRLTKTGLSQDLSAPDIDLLPDPRTATQGLLAKLSDDRELSGFARLVTHVMAAVSLPQSLRADNDCATGGVSDITNRGDLDRLLLSELAHDNTTLAVRVALNEALYLRRESPPQPQAQVRPVFIDNSLPMWGTPRLYATAVAMALQAGTTGRAGCSFWRPDGNDVTSVDLATRDGVAEHLNALSAEEHPADAIAALQRAMNLQPESQAEPVLITTEDILANNDFRHALDEGQLSDVWVITTGRDGRLVVYRRTRQGLVVYRRVELPLDEILNDPSELGWGIDETRPAIFGLTEFPLRLSHQTRAGRIWQWNGTAISLTEDGRLMHWPVAGQGAKELLDDVPSKRATCFVLERSAGCLRLLMSGREAVLVTLRWPRLDVRRVKIDRRSDMLFGARIHAGVLLLFGCSELNSRSCSAVSMETGEHLEQITWANGSLSQFAGRRLSWRDPVEDTDTFMPAYYQNNRCVFLGDPPNSGWNVLSWNGSTFETERLPDEMQSAQAVCEATGGRYFWITESHEIADSTRPGRLPLFSQADPPRHVRGFVPYVPGNNRLCVHTAGTAIAFDPDRDEISTNLPMMTRPEDLEFESLRKHCRIKTPHWRFAMIGISSAGVMQLKSATGKVFQIGLVNGHVRLSPWESRATTGTHMIPFDRSQAGRLQRAEWESGGRAWLDSRGLLHLKAAESDVPEVTLVLRDGALSGWISTGQLFGDDYYCGSKEESQFDRISPTEAWNSHFAMLLRTPSFGEC